ncbi:hypothetical protein HN953_01315 [Candidatus Woesearchaeota archaeon]|jgi:hypothetical protein|nr:hypothetical protein [Candidatus Woesearchaeota archaeon]
MKLYIKILDKTNLKLIDYYTNYEPYHKGSCISIELMCPCEKFYNIGECRQNFVKGVRKTNTKNIGKCLTNDIVNLFIEIIQKCMDGAGNACLTAINNCSTYEKSDCCDCLFGYFKDQCIAMKA